MAERDSSEASNVQLSEIQLMPGNGTSTDAGNRPALARRSRFYKVADIVTAKAAIENWMPCDTCGCGAIAHGYDEPLQRCLCGKCPRYRRRIRGQNPLPDAS